MRVLQIAKYAPPALGGIESFVRDLSAAFTKQGHENLILAHTDKASEKQTELSASLGRIIRVRSYGELMYAPIAPTYPLHLYRQLRYFKPNLILVHMPNVSGFWPLFMTRDCPMVVYWHSDVVFPREKQVHKIVYRAYSLFEKRLLEKADHIVATSPPYLEHSETLRPFRKKCKVIPLGIDANRIPPISDTQVATLKRRWLGDENARYVYAAGRFAHYKGFDRLVRAAALVRRTNPGLKFIIAGDGETRPKVLRLIERMGLEETVFCPGRVDDNNYWTLMKGCELFCLPSVERSEAFGVVLLEAMALGKPCLSTAIPGSGTGWVNKDGKTGIVVPHDDVEALADGIGSLLTSRWQQLMPTFDYDISEAAYCLAALGR